MKAGVLALQGDFREHAAVLTDLGVSPVLVRTAEELDEVDCLAIPGGESTTISRLARAHGLIDPIRDRAASGMPVLGTCAGLIVMATRVDGGEPLLSLLDVRVARNAYGRQVDSFEADLDAPSLEGGSIRGVFIRAPVIEELGEGVEVLARHQGSAAAVEDGALLGAAFHPEMAGDGRLHRRMLEKVG
ncbi:MAG: pyridoxal 5'-phosphate synthase glutaminase subunit PdxT [Actinomycetota bacterium]|nr:pyridoxal 5'-phosphate synthase glutaminase subunit PdxT [Actinomycetota bacterium]